MATEPLHTDAALLEQIAKGNKESFALLYRRYWEPLFEIAAKALRSKEEAGDVVQDVFISVWNRRENLMITGSLAAYLATSVRYKAIHYIEKNITRADYLSRLTSHVASHSIPEGEARLQLKEIQQSIEGAVAKMPLKMQKVYRMSREEHLSHKEIADRLGISEETVKKHIQHALALIRTAMGQTGTSLTLILFYLTK